jgi:hypothetical protein
LEFAGVIENVSGPEYFDKSFQVEFVIKIGAVDLVIKERPFSEKLGFEKKGFLPTILENTRPAEKISI